MNDIERQIYMILSENKAEMLYKLDELNHQRSVIKRNLAEIEVILTELTKKEVGGLI
jgi:hypothetical protein